MLLKIPTIWDYKKIVKSRKALYFGSLSRRSISVTSSWNSHLNIAPWATESATTFTKSLLAATNDRPAGAKVEEGDDSLSPSTAWRRTNHWIPGPSDGGLELKGTQFGW
ncbi:unnamed protein product [Euphydryas editha]|uniref:Uncharacterized protein n=1 Tax=Euphydryas editha TaxID=104508 RepID=A0AAU9UPZ7_EUPED|nr:unnamed protein product [Euphydryas editha]